MLRDRKQLGAVAAGEQKISALTRNAATLSDLGEAPESHTELTGRPMARVTEPVSAGVSGGRIYYKTGRDNHDNHSTSRFHPILLHCVSILFNIID